MEMSRKIEKLKKDEEKEFKKGRKRVQSTNKAKASQNLAGEEEKKGKAKR